MAKQQRLPSIVLSDRTRVQVRPIHSGDTVRLQAFVTRCSPRTIYLRTNMVRPAALSDSEAAYLTHVDYCSSMALVALAGAEPHDRIVAVARYSGGQPVAGHAEAAIMVEDAYQRRGLGWQLLTHLAAYAHDQGLSSLVGNISVYNEAVLAMIRRTGFAADYLDVGCGECQVTVPLPQRMPSLAGRPGSLPARAARRVGRSLQWHWGLATHLALLARHE
jgi:GNAT superfamily N-acetyltransferase